jgi:hypothetical protein
VLKILKFFDADPDPGSGSAILPATNLEEEQQGFENKRTSG